jgi:photosystem II stability/assembly factor-like uncharacterized protein
MTLKPIFWCIAFFGLLAFPLHAQNYQYINNGQPASLKNLQKSMADWADTANIQQAKHWKYLKRWEHELSLHTDKNGELGDAQELIEYQIQKSSSRNSSSFSASWYPVGPNLVPENYTGYLENGIGRINCMAFHPTDPQTFFVGVAQGGVWKTTNAGVSWTPLTDDLPILRVSDIVIDAVDPNIMYISLCDFEYIGAGLDLDGRKRHTHYGLGVFKTTDGGQTWSPTGLSFEQEDFDASLIRKILINPENSSELVACGVSGMYKSQDAGNTWNQVLDSLFWDLVQDPSNPQTLYAATGWVYSANTGSASIMKSNDFGNTWTVLPTNIPEQGFVQRIKIAIAPGNSNFIYAAAVDTLGGLHGIYKSQNAGNSWDFIQPDPFNPLNGSNGQGFGGQGTYDLVLHVDQFDPLKIYIGGVNMYMSEDGGQFFQPVCHWTIYYGPTIHADHHFMMQHPLTNEYFVCNDGGLYKTDLILSQSWTDAENGAFWPSVWQNLSNGMQVTSYYRISSSNTLDGRIIAGAQDNATSYYDGTSWRAIFGGDGMDNLLNPNNDLLVIGSSQFGYFYLSDDGAQSSVFEMQCNLFQEAGEWTTPIEGCFTNGEKIYVGYQTVNVSNDGGFSWETPGFIDGIEMPMSALGVSAINCDVVYAASRINYFDQIPSQVYRSIDGAANWTNISNGLPTDLYVTALAVHEQNPYRVVAVMAGFSAGEKVYQSFDGGQNWNNISFNLGNFPVNTVKFLWESDNLLIGTDAGVFMLKPDLDVWIDESNGLPNVIVSDIEINESANKIYVSTFGRGIWASDLNVLLNVSSIDKCEPTIKFAELSENTRSILVEENACRKSFQKLEIIDVMGRLIETKSIQGNEIQFQTNAMSSGVYFARLIGNGNSAVQKFSVR